eukprot:4138775-Amphidinium_carterae.1
MAFGLKSAVVNFNRVPALLISALRRLFGVLLWQFFDDTGYIQMQSDDTETSAAQLIDVLFKAAGLPNADKNKNLPSSTLVHLGVQLDLTQL